MKHLKPTHPHLYQVLLECRKCGKEFGAAFLKIIIPGVAIDPALPTEGVCFVCQGDDILKNADKR